MRHVHQAQLLVTEQLVDAPAPRACDDQTFELPTGIYTAMALMFTGFVLVLSLAFGGHMAVSFGVIFAFLLAFFGVPGLFPRMKGAGDRRALRWSEFADRGISTATGRTTASDATILVLVLPFLILCFAIAVTAIAALV